MILVPDLVQPDLFKQQIAPHLTPGKMLMFAHGFAIRFGWITPPEGVDVSMVAPKAPGHRVREVFKEGAGVPGLVAIHARRHRQGAGRDAGLRQGHRLHARRRDRDDVLGRNRDRSVRRAGGAVRRRQRAGHGRLRDAGRSRLPAGDRLLRVPARAEADRRPDVSRRPRASCATRSATPPSTATTPAARASSPTRPSEDDAADAGGDPSGAYAEKLARETKSGWFQAERERQREHQIEQVGAKLRARMPFLEPVDAEAGSAIRDQQSEIEI